MKKVILTGGIASGKTEASKIFQTLGVPVIDSDKISHDLLKINTPEYKQIITHFGPNLLKPNQEINRQALGAIIFSNPNEKIWLESLLHPPVLSEIKSQLDKLEQHSPAYPYCIIDIPLYAELILSKNKPADLISAFKKLGDKILVIDLEPENQITRLKARYQQQQIQPDLQKIQAILASQASRSQRNALADDIILNNQDLSSLRYAIETLHLHYSQLS
jgi:dephospho-CoA kinase